MVLFGALALAELFSRRSIATLEKLRLITCDLPSKLAMGTRDFTWPESSVSETNHLINNFREMAESLSAQFKEVQQVNKSLELRVEERTRKLNAIINASPVPFAMNDEEMNVTLLNPAFVDTFGYTIEDIPTLEDWWSKAYPNPDYRLYISSTWVEHLEKARNTSNNFEPIEARIQCKDGTVKTVIASAAALEHAYKDEHIVMLYDITSRKEFEDELHHRNAMLTRTETLANVGSWEWNVATDDVKWSDELFNIFQLDPTNGAPPFAKQSHLYPPEDLERLRLVVSTSLSKGEPFELELRIIRADGEIRHCLGRGYVETGPSEGNTRMFGLLQDITARKQVEESLRESEQRYRIFFEGAESIKLIIDPSTGAIIDANQAAVRFYGYSLEQLQNKFLYEINTLPNDQLLYILDKVVVDGEGHFYFKHRLSNHDIRDVEIHTSPISIGGRYLIQSSIHDVTELRRLEQIKEDVERIIRHDLKTPLGGIINILNLMREDNLTNEQREILSLVAISGRKMLSQINSSLELHKIEGGTYKLNLEPCNPIQVLQENADMLAMSLNVGRDLIQIRDRGAVQEEAFSIRTDKMLLDIVVMNLLRNALEASDPDAPVFVDLSVERDALILAISNSRPVPVEIRERFFEKYATAGKKGGTGLGTYSAFIMTRAIGGTIDMETSDETGTKVTVRIPMSPRESNTN